MLFGACLTFLIAAGLLLLQTPPARAAVLDDLAGYWKFDESSYGTAADSSGQGNTLTSANNPASSTDVPAAMGTAFPDSRSASFNGSTQYFSVADNSTLDDTSAVSVSTWVKFNNVSGNQTIAAKWQVGTKQQWVLQLDSGGHISWWTGDGGSGSVNQLTSNASIAAGTWYHLVATATSGSKKLYINGSLDNSNAGGAMGLASSTPLTVGSKMNSSSGFFEYLNGSVDDLRVYSRTLNGTEVGNLAAGSETIATYLTGGSAITNESGTSSAITDLQVASNLANPTVSVKLLVSHGTLSMTTTTGLTFKNASGTTLSNPQTGGTLYFSGSMNDVNAALATLHYSRTSGTGSDTLEASLVDPGEVFFPDNNHLYEYVSVPGGITWTNAKTAAEARSKYGAQGYLTTIASQAENDFVAARLLNAGWMGASDSGSEGTWKWVTGPESGTTFSTGNVNPVTASGQYANWNNGEPNDSGGNEDCGQFLTGGTGKWNDLPCTGTGSGTLPGYVVEYGGLNDTNPTVSSQNVGITTITDATPPTKPGTPTASSSSTTDNTPTISWTASSDGGSGLKNPAYTLEWSTSATFASVAGSATTNSTSLAPSSSLADGTWYFRVKATDNSNNVATSNISSALVVDTTGPTKPGTPVASTASNDNTPTFDWTASTDSGTGLATIAYAVEWSQDTGFFGLGGQAGVTDNSYTIPDNLSMTDSTWYFRVKAIDVLGNESAWSDYATVHIDTVVPVISGVGASGVSAEQEAITWTTDKDTSSKVSYGPTASLGSSTSETDTSPRIKNHSVTLDNLVACSIYHYVVTSKDAAGNVATSSDRSFITSGCAGSADVIAHADAPITTVGGGSLNLKTISVSVPKGFAAVDADFQIKQIEHAPALGAIGAPAGLTLAASHIYDIKALQNGTTAITSFAKPIVITLHYTSAEIAKLIESSLVIYRWDAGMGWTKLSSCKANASANSVTCTTTHFSTFALYGVAKIASPTVATDDESSTNGKSDSAVQPNGSSASSATVNEDDSDTADKTSDDQSLSSSSTSGNDETAKADTNARDDDPVTAGFNWWWLLAVAVVVVGGWWFIAAKRRKRKTNES